MRSEDLQITALNGGYSVSVAGRANFDYAVPLRELAQKLTADDWLQIDLENCEAMDSTFMGVLTMLALKLRKRGFQVMLIGASEVLLKLLRDLGVAKLFNCVGEREFAGGVKVETAVAGDMLTTAETVAEAHKALVGADESNAEKFKQVIEFADKDVERLKKSNQ
jgi:anti-anti-sigma regulatory factor